MSAFWATLVTGRPAIVISTDRGMFDTSYKLWYLLDSDYTAWHVAKRLKRGGYRRNEVFSSNDANWPFEGDLETYEVVSNIFAEAFDDDFVSTSLTTILLNHDDSAYVNVVRIPRDLNAYLRFKPLNDWRNTSQFGDRNVHIGLNIVAEKLARFIGVAKDRTRPLGGGIQASEIDVFRAIHDVEQHVSLIAGGPG